MRRLHCSRDQTHFSPVMEPRREVPAACALSDSGGVALAASICAFTGKTGSLTGQRVRSGPGLRVFDRQKQQTT